MVKAIWNNTIIAESNATIVVDDNHYFPHSTIKKEYFKESETHTNCHWKGLANYYHIDVDGKINEDGAWYYPNTKEKAKNIENYVAFWRGVKVTTE